MAYPVELTQGSPGLVPFSEVGGVGKVDRSFNAQDEKARDSSGFFVVMKVAVYVCARYVAQK